MSRSNTATYKASTDLVWAIANWKKTPKQHTQEEMVDLLSAMYPGIDYWHTQLSTVAKEIAGPDILKGHPELRNFRTGNDAVKALGKTLGVSAVRPCKGYEWEDWRPAPTG